jgi:hypothetical protein
VIGTATVVAESCANKATENTATVAANVIILFILSFLAASAACELGRSWMTTRSADHVGDLTPRARNSIRQYRDPSDTGNHAVHIKNNSPSLIHSESMSRKTF